MERNDVKYINGVPVARMQDYGYRDFRILQKIWKVISTILVFIVILLVYLSVIIIAIKSFNADTAQSEFTKFTFDHYLNMFSEASLTYSIENTFKISLAATAISTIAGTLVAVGIHYLFGKKRQYIMMLNNIPLLNADIVTGISIMLIFSLVMRIPGLEYIFGFPTMLVSHVYFCLPYVILNVLPKLKEIDSNMMDAALDLGLRPSKALLQVIVPAIKSGIFAGLIFAFTMSFDDFVISYYTTGNGFNNLSIWIYSSIGRKSLKPQVYAFSTLITFGAMAILLICNFLSGRKGAKYGKKK
ncbi:MAG: ABC transporter permease [Bacilli bacterium]|jgi:spermidine/putrescine transport system permease protein|nr:ABC transporter permease [Bacilli bacterium]